jgi:hypothetical protein
MAKYELLRPIRLKNIKRDIPIMTGGIMMGLAIKARIRSTNLLRRLLMTYAAGVHKSIVIIVVKPATIRLFMKARTHSGRLKTSRYHL